MLRQFISYVKNCSRKRKCDDDDGKEGYNLTIIISFYFDLHRARRQFTIISSLFYLLFSRSVQWSGDNVKWSKLDNAMSD